MTVSTELSHEEYTGNGVTTDFDFRFRIFEAKHLVVSVADPDGTERILTNGTDYTLRGVGSYRGGKVILKMPLATGWKIGIARDLPVVQETDLRNQGKFFAEVHEDALDYLTMLIQKSLGYLSLCLRKPSFISDHYDAKGNKISNLGKPVKDGDAVDLGTMKEHISAKDKRSLRVADKDIPALPGTAVRRNKQLGFDNNGMPLLLDPAETGALGYVLVDSFEDGAVITSRYQALHWLHNGEYYRWDGGLPKSVPAGSTPESSGGVGTGAWVSVGDANLRTEISDPDGAKKYPTLQVARWRDDMDVRGWGVFPDGTDVTAKLCAALDYANGDYSQQVEYGKNRKPLYIPPGDYLVDMTKLIGIHALLGRFIIRCNINCLGRILNADISVLHARSLNITGISCKSFIVQGAQFHNISNISLTGNFELKGSKLQLPGLLPWGSGTNSGGTYWNTITNIKCGTTSSLTGGKFIVNIYDGSVNQNCMNNILGAIEVLGQGNDPNGSNYEANANTFICVDTSGTHGYMLDNKAIPAQHNVIIGLYGEVNGSGKIRGPWTILGARAQYGGWVSTMSHMNTIIGTDPTSGQQGGDTISVSATNMCPSGDWSVLGHNGGPEDYSVLGIPNEAIIVSDINEPGGCGRYFGVDHASERCRIIVKLTKAPTGYIRGSFYFKGDTPVEIVIEDQSGGNTIYMPVDKYYSMEGDDRGWKLYRVSAPTIDKTKAYRLRITVDAGKVGKIGTSFFSCYNASVLPTFCGWSKVIVRSTGVPDIADYGLLPIGLRCIRTSPSSIPSDPTIGWHWTGAKWIKINAS